LLADYDKKIIKVVEKHEHDFLHAYKTHMSKVERELQQLKAKADEQELRLKNDERIVKLDKSLQWFRSEVDRLVKMKEDNFNTIEMLSTKVQTMIAEKRFMEEQVKASKRQNKLLVMALAK
jgi:protein associated with RNAse G/E